MATATLLFFSPVLNAYLVCALLQQHSEVFAGGELADVLGKAVSGLIQATSQPNIASQLWQLADVSSLGSFIALNTNEPSTSLSTLSALYYLSIGNLNKAKNLFLHIAFELSVIAQLHVRWTKQQSDTTLADLFVALWRRQTCVHACFDLGHSYKLS